MDGKTNRGAVPQAWTPWKATRHWSLGLGTCLSNIYTLSVEGESNSNPLPRETACLAGCLGIYQAYIVDLLQFCTLLT